MDKQKSIRECIGKRIEFDVPKTESYHAMSILTFNPLTEEFQIEGYWRSPVDVTVGWHHYSRYTEATEEELLAIQRAKASHREKLAAEQELERVRVYFNRF